MALSQCNVLTAGPPGQAIGEVSIDSTVSPGSDYYIVEHSLTGPLGPWLNPDQSGGINGGSVPLVVFEVRSGNPPGVPIWFRWRQFDPADNFLDEEICQGLTVPLPVIGPQPTGEVCCGLVVREDWEVSEYGYNDVGYGHRFHQCYPPGTGSTQ